MYYINACSTLSHQPTFQNKNWVDELSELSENSDLITPNYKAFINPANLRRMSKIIRMGITCSKDCTQQANIENPDAIIVGTGLGCLLNTEIFLNNALTIKGLIPPTAFIQSTHNTIGGQISLALNNHNYNMTHTQNSLSFEHALKDAMLCLDEGNNNVLVGSADENITLMDELAIQLGWKSISNKMTTGASFFMLSSNYTASSKAQITDSLTIGLNTENAETVINSFLKSNNLKKDAIDLILFNSNNTINNKKTIKDLQPSPVFCYEKYCGYYFTNAAFGMHLATEILNKNPPFIKDTKPCNRILLYNNFKNKNIGLTLLQSLET